MAAIEPTANARQIFGGHLYRMISPLQEDFILSTGAILKLLASLSLGADCNLSDSILWDLYIKHVDQSRLRDEASREGIFDMGFSMQVRQRLENELSAHIERDVLLNFLSNDFNELCECVEFRNFIVANDDGLQFNDKFRNFIKDYCNVTSIQRKNSEELQLLDPMGLTGLSSKRSLDVFGSVSFKFQLHEPFVMNSDDGTFEACGLFKYKELPNSNSLEFRAHVLEIPLQSNPNSGLHMIVFLPNEFYTLVKQSIGRDYTDFDVISRQLEPKMVKVKLPNFKMDKRIELANFFAENSRRGLRRFFKEPISLERMFENSDKLNFGNYWQRTSLEMCAPKGDGSEKSTPTDYDVEFDATNKPILFVIKSQKAVYVMGHYSK